jgi:carbon monoxide dehydrogenase subunit G
MKNQKNQTKKGALLLTVLASIAILFCACCKDADKRELVKKELEITGEIKGIIVEGPWEVYVEQNNEKSSATIEYNIPEKRITTTLRPNGYLHIKISNSYNYRNVKLKASICAATLERIDGRGATAIYTYGQFLTTTDIALSGASKMDGFLCEGNNAKIHLGGASEILNCVFKGSHFNADISGASKILSLDLDVSNCTVNASGASRFNGNGSALETSFTGSGASHFYTFDIESNNLNVHLSGASEADVTVNNTIRGDLSGASTLRYKKAVNVSGVSTSGGSKIIRVE